MTQSKNENNLEISIQTKDLAHALSFTTSVVEKRNVLSELSNIKLIAKNNMLEISATDMDIYLKQSIGAKVISEGGTSVSTQTISDIIRKIPDSEVKLKQSHDSGKLEIIGSNCHFELLTLPAKGFPEMEDIDSNNSFGVSCTELAKIIEYTHFSVSTDETRYNLNGIYLHIKDKDFRGVATDGHRLSIATTDLAEKSKDFGAIIPKKTVAELLKIIKDSRNIQSDVQISLATNKIKFLCNNLLLISKLIDGNFPDYSGFIPSDNTSLLTVNTKLLASAIDRVATITVDKFRAVKLIINDKAMKVTAFGETKGSANEDLSFSEDENNYCKFSGTEITIGFNPKYISDVLGAIKEDQVDIYFKDSFSPVLIKSKENESNNFVIMPVKV
ncbi:DNA polymerase III subunit beta [Rickettsiaceae bacterium]|nr:DNA polymerase III subunit beta [Rickettsiaceae bacterium]